VDMLGFLITGGREAGSNGGLRGSSYANIR